ncbi:ornithine cyclodeaminase family protein [Leucobacter viscericola]|uniref:Ornithine cyclodeaminase family protein n=1 Tax=Leucobacter viscericola TaxID=2714935 RepID=A0A6G7XIM5_9MICO|nr:ornithine cyclodeaminase family protein [Leucobacter viscericola]QIK64289.1 ornithine cyclodeaminase family protein [Leucobacter viscericola]
MNNLPYFNADEVRAALPYDRAVRALEEGLQGGVNPEEDGPRLFSPAPDGEFLLMPAQGNDFSGVKALTVAPNNPARGLEKIQGLYILYSSDTLAPAAVLEGSSLTAIRTPAVTLLAVSRIAAMDDSFPDAPRMLVFGAGIQAAGHIAAAHALFPSAEFAVIGRSAERVASLRAQFPDLEITDRGADRDAAVREADVILCTTTSTSPLFDGSLVCDTAIVAAVGTHGLDHRELDDALVSRADIVVEGRKSARAENGNLSTALSDEDWERRPPANLKDLVTGGFVRTPGRPACYTGVGMSWEDLICAAAVFTKGQSASGR